MITMHQIHGYMHTKFIRDTYTHELPTYTHGVHTLMWSDIIVTHTRTYKWLCTTVVIAPIWDTHMQIYMHSFMNVFHPKLDAKFPKDWSFVPVCKTCQWLVLVLPPTGGGGTEYSWSCSASPGGTLLTQIIAPLFLFPIHFRMRCTSPRLAVRKSCSIGKFFAASTTNP